MVFAKSFIVNKFIITEMIAIAFINEKDFNMLPASKSKCIYFNYFNTYKKIAKWITNNRVNIN